MKNKLFFLIGLQMLCFAHLAFSSFYIKNAEKTQKIYAYTDSTILKDKSQQAHLPNDRYKNEGMGIASLVLGIVGCVAVITFFGGVILGILAIVFGKIGMKKHQLYSKAGFILGIVSVALAVLALLVLIILFATGAFY